MSVSSHEKRRGGAAALLAVAAWCTAPATASARCNDARYVRAMRLRTQQQDEAALAIFQRLWEERHEPCALARVALTEDALQRWPEAEEHLQEALRASRNPWIRRYRRVLSSQLGVIGTHLGSLQLTGPAGAEVWVGGRRRGLLPLARPIRLPLGRADIELRIATGETVRREATVTEGQAQSIVVAPVPPPPPPPPLPPTRAATPAVEPDAVRARPIERVVHRDSARRGHMVWGGVAAGLAVISLGVAVGLHVRREDQAVSYNGDTSPTGCRATLGDPMSSAAQLTGCEARQQEVFRATVPWILGGYVAAGTMAALSAILFSTAPARTTESASRFACAPGITAPSVHCVVTF